MTSRRQKSPSDKVEVPDADIMLAQVFRLHCQKRHPMMRFRSRGEHAADHRLHDDSLDHIHKIDAPEDVNKDAGAGEREDTEAAGS